MTRSLAHQLHYYGGMKFLAAIVFALTVTCTAAAQDRPLNPLLDKEAQREAASYKLCEIQEVMGGQQADMAHTTQVENASGVINLRERRIDAELMMTYRASLAQAKKALRTLKVKPLPCDEVSNRRMLSDNADWILRTQY